MFLKDRDWEHHLTRPFSLFGASLWYAWYQSEALFKYVGVTIPDALFIEKHTNVVGFYMDRVQRSRLREAICLIGREEPEKLASIFNRADILNAQAELFLKGDKQFADFNSAKNFAFEQAICATVVPNAVLGFIATMPERSELVAHGERLRSTSFYPGILRNCLLPLARQCLGTGKEDSELFTLHEVLAKDITSIDQRLRARTSGQRFVCRCLDNTEIVEWVNDSRSLTIDLEAHEQVEQGILRGQTACKGFVRGRARVVLTNDADTVSIFDEGDILVSINSTPALMPLILKAGAIVTDEGGVACHAAIISRELKKPCVIGTKIATQVIKDGDIIEVDADAGVVRY